MMLNTSTWLEVDAYLQGSKSIVIPTGSTEQHGPIGLIGTDTICAETIAKTLGEKSGALISPTLALTPAPFNLGFPGTISISEKTFEAMIQEIIEGLAFQGFEKFYFLNGHGANIAPLKQAASTVPNIDIRIRSWWDFEPVNILRQTYYGDWEGMHATPSEVAITQFTHRTVTHDLAGIAPQKLTPKFMATHAGDKHGPPDQHRNDFPDGRVGSHSALARPEHGQTIFDAAVLAISEDYNDWAGSTL